MSQAQLGELVAAIYLTLVGLGAARLWRLRRAQHALRWPVSTTQREMEKYGSRFMARLGWSVMLSASHGSHSMYGCIKHGEYLYVVFLRDSSFMARLLSSLRRESSKTLGRLAVVTYTVPSEAMRLAASDSRVSLMHYKDLPSIEELHQAVLPKVTAARTAPPTPQRGPVGVLRRGPG